MKRHCWLLLFFSTLLALGAWACGPFLSSAFISNPHAVLAPPETHFVSEMKRLSRLPEPPKGVGATKDWPPPLTSTLELDVADLKSYFEEKSLPEEGYRELLTEYGKLRRQQLERSGDKSHALPRSDELYAGKLLLTKQEILEGIPREFQLYVTGAALCYQGDRGAARDQWTQLLALPKEHRKYRSVWAAWMMGRTAPNGEEALHWYREVGRLVEEEKCLDSLRMAAAAAGRLANFEKDAAVVLRSRFYNFRENQRKRYEEDLLSIKKDLLVDQKALEEVAKSVDITELMSAMLMQQGRKYYPVRWRDYTSVDQPDWRNDLHKWLEAVKKANIPDKALPPQLGIAAYRAGDYALAEAILKQSAKTWEAQWIQGKLALQKGRQKEAAQLLAAALKSMPQQEKQFTSSITEDEAAVFENDWWQGFRTHEEWNDQTVQDKVRGLRHSRLLADMGTVELAQSDFVSALRIFVQAECPHDAAYVAERLLSAEELLSIIRKWKWAYSNSKDTEKQSYTDFYELRNDVTQFLHQQNESGLSYTEARLLYVTARKLAREHFFKDARSYYPAPLLPYFDRYVSLYRRGHSGLHSQETRAEALWEAARLERSMGALLFGTDGEPDGELYRGNFSYAQMAARRIAWAANKDFDHGFYQEIGKLEDMRPIKVPLKPSKEEIYRLNQYRLEWEKRFHYRYTASDLAWQAASLMPSNSDETAAVYCEAGKWIYRRDAKAADRFYKRMIWRNWETPLARKADELRWFPNEDVLPRYNPFVAIKMPLPGDE